jgi:hypothetical protein
MPALLKKGVSIVINTNEKTQKYIKLLLAYANAAIVTPPQNGLPKSRS